MLPQRKKAGLGSMLKSARCFFVRLCYGLGLSCVWKTNYQFASSTLQTRLKKEMKLIISQWKPGTRLTFPHYHGLPPLQHQPCHQQLGPQVPLLWRSWQRLAAKHSRQGEKPGGQKTRPAEYSLLWTGWWTRTGCCWQIWAGLNRWSVTRPSSPARRSLVWISNITRTRG